ncbi:alanine racemase, partial [candidate division KSB1 bacterium]
MNIPVRNSFAEIDLKAFRWNFDQIKKQVQPAKIASVVKANAYGHGDIRISEQAVMSGTEYLCFEIVQNGIRIRKSGINAPILIFIPPGNDEIEPAILKNLDLTVNSLKTAENISDAAAAINKTAKVHIFIDTGMHNIGIDWNSAPELIHKIEKLPNVEIKGLCTHFATSDWSDLTFAYDQLERFDSVIKKIDPDIPFIHCASTGAILQMKESYFNMVRPGIGLYGYYPSMICKRTLHLKPVMSLRSYVSHISEFEKGEEFGYSLTYRTGKRTKIVSVPVGYGDGINRLLSNNSEVLIGGRKYPVIGRVAMDWIMVDIGLDNKIMENDEVVLLGKQN